MNNFDDPHEKIAQRVDEKIGMGKPTSLSPELRKVKDNLQFIHKIAKEPIEKDTHAKKVFGAVLVDPLPVVFGDNIWNRSIFTVDELCDMYDSATLKQRLKYAHKKRSVDSKLMFILLLVGIGGFAIIVMLLAMGVFG